VQGLSANFVSKEKRTMLKRNKRLFGYLLALGLLLAQSTLVYAEYDHPLHAPDAKCPICLAVDHLSNGLTDTGVALDFHPYASPQADAAVVGLVIPFRVSCLIRGPPRS
jgi:hypothetical protein